VPAAMPSGGRLADDPNALDDDTPPTDAVRSVVLIKLSGGVHLDAYRSQHDG